MTDSRQAQTFEQWWNQHVYGWQHSGVEYQIAMATWHVARREAIAECAKVADDWARSYSTDVFSDVSIDAANRANEILQPVGLCVDLWSAASGRNSSRCIAENIRALSAPEPPKGK